MPWIRATLKNNKVYARADGEGRLVVAEGTVEIRYKPNDGRRYRARPASLVVTDGTPLPDETCGDASDVARDAAPRPSTSPRRPAAPKAAPESALDPSRGPIAYTDGACSGNPGPAGVGVVLHLADRRVEVSEWLGQATNNIAELTGILRALERTDPSLPIVIHTDSSYAIGVLQKGWKAKANQALIATIKDAMRGRAVRLVYVPGHAGVTWNERADELARLAVTSRRTTSSEHPVASSALRPAP